MTNEPPPMSSALRALVDADNRRPGPSDTDRNRVYAALGVSLGLPVGAVVAAHAASASAATGAGSAVATTVSAASAVGRVALIVKAPLVSVGVGAVLGAALTAYVVKGPVARWSASARARRAVATAAVPARAAAPIAPPVVPAPAVAAPALPSAAAASPTPAEAPVPVDERPTAAPAAPRHAVAAPSATTRERLERAQDRVPDRAQDRVPDRQDQQDRMNDEEHVAAPVASAGVLSAEQALLDPARVAIARGDGAGALARLALHERRFPNGALSQEREAMAIRALVLTGDRDRARARAESFRSRYPGSLLWPMIAASLDAPLGSRH